MSDTVPVQYVGPFDIVELAPTGQEVERGHIIDVPAAVAGRPPSEAQGVEGDADYVGADPGEGLLAQVDNWVPGDLDAMNVDALKSYAGVLDVDVSGLKRKGDIVAAIRKAAAEEAPLVELTDEELQDHDPPATEDTAPIGADPQE